MANTDTLIRFWKPYGVLTKFTDAENRPTLAGYISLKNVYAIGRLDLDSEGLLLLTNNGQLNSRLIDPKHAHPRTYWAQVERVPTEEALAQLRAGVELSDKGKKWMTLPAKAELLTVEPELPPRTPPIRYRANIPTAWISLTITEGKNRQVRRMTAAVGFPTLRLVRAAIGGITLAGLNEGEWSHLTPHQINQLWRK